MKINLQSIAVLFLLLASIACKKDDKTNLPAPPETWQEHWFEHKQFVKRVYYDNSVVVYFDNDVAPTVKWPFSYLKKVWDYTTATYGSLWGNSADKRLYAIFHTGKYGGGHPSYYYSSTHDFRNVIDCGSPSANAWVTGTGNDLDLVTHEVGHIVESTTHSTQGSPAFKIWGDSKWAEIYIYDVYKGLGMSADADRWYNMMMAQKDNFPAANVQWFKNWFYPIYSKYGGNKVLTKFFKVLADNFPKDNNGKYTRDLNWGEFIHFWSGAAGANLKAQATTAFGWPAAWETQFVQAQKDFSQIKY